MASGSTELRSKIKLILSQVTRNSPIYVLTTTGAFGGGSLEIPIAPPGTAKMINEQVILLTRLYSASTPQSQKLFPALLLSEITPDTAAVIVQVFLETGHLSQLESALAKVKWFTHELRTLMWETIRAALMMEAHRFSEEDLVRLEAMRKTELNRVPRLKREKERR